MQATTGIGTAQQDTADDRVPVNVVDCDIHLVPRSLDEIVERLPEPSRSRLGTRRARASGKTAYGSMDSVDPDSGKGIEKRLDSYPTSGGPPGSEPRLVYRQLIEDAGVDIALVISEVRATVDPEINAAWCRAHNEWLAETWLDRCNFGGRLFGSITVSLDDPARAVQEIEYWADHPRFKQVLVGDVAFRPFGFPLFHQVWSAAARHGLPVAMHFGGHGAGLLGASPVGRFQRHVDYHSVAYPLVYSAHLASLICSGILDSEPDFRFVFVEGGFLWHRAILTRLAAHWPLFEADMPASSDSPMDYMRRHFRFTSQPIEESDDQAGLAQLMELSDAANLLMMSTDYPHYDFDQPNRALPRRLSREAREKIMARNAIELYDLPTSLPRFDPLTLPADLP